MRSERSPEPGMKGLPQHKICCGCYLSKWQLLITSLLLVGCSRGRNANDAERSDVLMLLLSSSFTTHGLRGVCALWAALVLLWTALVLLADLL